MTNTAATSGERTPHGSEELNYALLRARQLRGAERVYALIDLFDRLPPGERESTEKQALAAARSISEPSARARALEMLAQKIPEREQQRRIQYEAGIAEAAISTDKHTIAIQASIDRLSQADPKDLPAVVSSQMDVLTQYYQNALSQSKDSFRWAVVGAAIGLVFFIVAITISMARGDLSASLISLLAGAVVEVVAGIVFYLYGKTSSQLQTCYDKLEILVRYYLANSICESLADTERNTAQSSLIHEMITRQTVSSITNLNPAVSGSAPRRRSRPASLKVSD